MEKNWRKLMLDKNDFDADSNSDGENVNEITKIMGNFPNTNDLIAFVNVKVDDNYNSFITCWTEQGPDLSQVNALRGEVKKA